MNKYIRALKIAIDCIKNPLKYHLLTDRRNYSVGDHEHICYPYRLLSNKDFKDCCPCSFAKDFNTPEHFDYCDKCPYFGFIDFLSDESGARSIKFGMDVGIVDIWSNELDVEMDEW